MTPLVQALEGQVEVMHVPDASMALARLLALLAPGDAVLVKGSNGVGLARVIAGLKGG